jgi:predicted component of type VI protein secretion system
MAQTATQSAAPVDPMTTSSATLILHHLEGARAGQQERYTQPVVVIGRAPDCHLVFDQEKGVSGRHCEIREANGQFELVDNNSTNGLFVGDERVTTRILRSGDLVRFGMMGPLVRVEIPGEPAATLAMPLPPVGGSTVVMSAVDLKAATAGSPPPAAAPTARPAAPPRVEPPRAAAPAPAQPVRPSATAPAPASPRVPVTSTTRPSGSPNMALRWVLAVATVVALGGGAALLAWLVVR